MTAKEAAAWILIILGGIILIAAFLLGFPVAFAGVFLGAYNALDPRGDIIWAPVFGFIIAPVFGLVLGSAAIYIGEKLRHPDMSNIGIGRASYAIGILSILLLLLVLGLLICGISTRELGTMYAHSVPWDQIVWPLVVIILGLVVSGLMVWGGWRLSHQRRRIRRTKPPDQSGDLSGE